MPRSARSRSAARRPVLLAATLALLTIVSAVVVNLATELVPDTLAWARNPWLIWGAVGLLAVVTALLAVWSQQVGARAREHERPDARPVGMVRVADAAARALGVHAAIALDYPRSGSAAVGRPATG